MQQTWGRYLIGAMIGMSMVALFAAPVRAEITEGSWETGASVIYSIYDNSSTIDDSLNFGVRGAYFFTPKHGIEVDIDFGDSDTKQSGSDIEFDIAKLGVSFVYNFETKSEVKFAPLFLIGFGQIEVDNGTDDDRATYIRAGGGVRYFYTPRWALRVDAKLYRWRGDNVVTPRNAFFTFDLTIGVSLLFGGEQ